MIAEGEGEEARTCITGTNSKVVHFEQFAQAISKLSQSFSKTCSKHIEF